MTALSARANLLARRGWHNRMRPSSVMRFEDLTRELIGVRGDLDVLHHGLVSLPKARRGSVKIGEQVFMSLMRAARVGHVIEAGGNDGRHTRRFLDETDAIVHVFEPNVFALPHFVDLLSDERLYMNCYGLSDVASLIGLQLPRRVGDMDLGRVSGMASIENRIVVGSSESHVSAFGRATDYFRHQSAIAAGRVGLWLDVEGHADLALAGFGSDLAERVDIVLVEVEYDDLYSRGANADVVIRQLEHAGLRVLYRDFMNVGQCNLLAVRPSLGGYVAESFGEVRRFYAEILAQYGDPASPDASAASV